MRIHVGGRGGGWRELADWPPPARTTIWHLQPGGGLAPTVPGPSAPDTLRYDPADPTPSLGGPLLVAQRAGRVDNGPLERCDVDPRGRSWNVCDGLTRVVPEGFRADADGVLRVPVELWPTAHRFDVGHRLRVQVSAGAHRRYARNPGTGEPLGTAVRLRAGEREIFHDPDHLSALYLPVTR